MCEITKGKKILECKDAIGGIKAIYIANYDSYGWTTSSTATGHQITGLGALDEVFKFELKNSGNTLNQTINTNRDNGTTFFTQTATFILNKISKEMEFQVKLLSWGRPQIFVELNSTQVILIGNEFGCEVTGTSGVGGTMDSLNGYTLTATAMEKDPWYFLDTASVASLKTKVSNQTL